MASSGDVLRALMQEARARGVHPDTESVFAEYEEANKSNEPEPDDEGDDKPEPATAPRRSAGQRGR